MSDIGKSLTVNLRCIKKCAAMLKAIPYGFNTVFFGRDFAVTVRKSHAAHSYLRYLNISQHSCFHTLTPLSEKFFYSA